ncbi:MAG: DUF1217 domain-containing protein [Alphaproteobacteria bacterium]
MVGISALASYTVLDRNEQRRAVALANAPYRKDLSAFKTDVAKIESLDDLFKNAKLLNTVLKAYDLETKAGDIEKLKEILTSKLSDPKSLVNTERDKRYLALAEDIDLYNGFAKIKSAVFAQKLEARLEQRYADRRLEPKQKTLILNSAVFKKDIADFKSRAAKVDSVDELFKDYRLLKIVLEAYDLDTEIDKAGFIKKVLTSDPTDKNALVSRVNDNRYRELALDIGLFSGVKGLKSSAFANRLEAKLAQTRFEHAVDDESPGVRAALHFRTAAPKIKSPYDILSDPVLRDVVLKATGLPLEIVRQPVESQARLLESRIDFDKLKDANYANRLIKRFLVLSEATPTLSGNGSLLDLFA